MNREVQAVLDFYQGGPIEGAFLQSVRDLNIDGAEVLFRVSMDFAITYRG